MVGDFGGGGMFLAFGVVCGILEAQRSGAGQVVDAAMVDGAATLMTMFWSFRNMGIFDENAPGTNLLDTGAHFYDVYECSDGLYVSIGSIERQFYAELLRLTGLDDDPAFAPQMDKTAWPDLKVKLAELFRTRTRAEWCELMEMTDVCFAPVLTLSEAAAHPAQRRAPDVRRGRRGHAAGAGSTIQPDRARDRRVAGVPRSALAGDPRGVGHRQGPHRRARRERRGDRHLKSKRRRAARHRTKMCAMHRARFRVSLVRRRRRRVRRRRRCRW